MLLSMQNACKEKLDEVYKREPNLTLGEFLKQIRNVYDMSPKKVSLKMKITAQTLYNVEKQRYAPSLSFLIKLADFYEIDPMLILNKFCKETLKKYRDKNGTV